jgi:hypothetical protein
LPSFQIQHFDKTTDTLSKNNCLTSASSKIMPWNGCGRDALPLAVVWWIDLPEFGGHLGNAAENLFGRKIDSDVDFTTFDNSLELPSENLG